MKEYKVGDIVTIKSLDWYNKNKDKSGTVGVPGSFVKDMSKHCGKITMITEVLNTPNRYHIKCDPEHWTWSAEMFEESPELTVINEKETMKYKVGDKVRLKSQEWYDNHEKDDDGFIRDECPSFNPEMCKYLGKIATIKTVSDCIYEIDLDREYWSWGDYMIECKVDDVELKEESSFKAGDFVQIKSKEWFEENKDEDYTIVENGIDFNPEYCGRIGQIIEYDSSDDTYKVQFDPNDEDDIIWFTSNWMNKIKEPDSWSDEDSEEDEGSDYNMPIEGDWVMVADKYSKEGPKEDWTIAKFIEARAKGIDTEEGIWNYCIVFDNFEPQYWEETLKHIYKGKDKKLVKV